MNFLVSKLILIPSHDRLPCPFHRFYNKEHLSLRLSTWSFLTNYHRTHICKQQAYLLPDEDVKMLNFNQF